jgi:hypothetical protein
MNTSNAAYDQSRTLMLAAGFGLLAVGGFILLSWGQQVVAMKLAYPVVATSIAVLLYFARPTMYVGFTLWIWFLTPFVRRVLDFQGGAYTALSYVMLTPYLVTGLAIITLMRFGGLLGRRDYAPFAFVLGGLFYGFAVGVARSGASAALFDLLEWLLPVLIAFHLYAHWDQYPAYRRVIRTTFVLGVAVMGTYGIVQYMVAPAWDMFWLTNSGMTTSMGRPEAFRFRVFSTLNATGPFAMVMIPGLLLLFDAKGTLPRLAAVPGYVSFLLTLVRGAWLGFVIGLGFLVLRVQGQMRARLLAVLVVGIVLSLPLLFYGPISGRVGARVDTLGDVSSDNSFRARMRLYGAASSSALLNPIGNGMGSIGAATRLETGDKGRSFDSGVLAVPFVLGWPGALLFAGGFLMLLRRAYRVREETEDQFAVIAAGVALSYFLLMAFANQLTGIKGVVAWSFLALALAAQRYYRDE